MPNESQMASLQERIGSCRLCADRFAGTTTRHQPRPVFWCNPSAVLLVAGQAPGNRVHESGIPFLDASGDRLRDWMGITKEEFYDRSRVAILPMAFCFPGYDGKGADLPPPVICAHTWRKDILGHLAGIRTTLLIGLHAQKWHLEGSFAANVTGTVRAWKEFAPACYPLPHPSWRNNGWLKRNPWFEEQVLPDLRSTVRELLDSPN